MRRAGRPMGRATGGGLQVDKNAKDAPDEPEYLEIYFERGIPVAINENEMDGVTLINTLNARGGKHGVGRIDHLENRLVGIKSGNL